MAPGAPPALEQEIAAARSPAQHEALAARYMEEAKASLAKAEQHDKRATAYGPATGYARIENDFAAHCRYLAGLYRDAAQQNIALARLHLRLARRTDD